MDKTISQPAVNPLGKRISADLLLLSAAIIWGSAFVVQRIAAPGLGILTFNGLRFLLAGFLLLPLAYHTRKGEKPLDKRTLLGVAMAGVLLWGGASLQHAGLRYTTAANAGFITGLYVVLIPLILRIGLKHSLPARNWWAAALAAIGLLLLTNPGRIRLNPGDILEFAGTGFWALHVILIGWLVQRSSVFQLATGQYLVCGALGLALGLVFESEQLRGLPNVWWAILYTAIFSVSLGYTLQAFGQKTAPPADAAIILSTEAVFAALFGWLLLSEGLTALQITGCALIFVGILLTHLRSNQHHSM